MSDRATGILLGTAVLALCCGAHAMVGTLIAVGLVGALGSLAWLFGPVLLGILVLAGTGFLQQRQSSRAPADAPLRPNQRQVGSS